eukprot:4838155-Lingulodinium_polyedra.AAC.1
MAAAAATATAEMAAATATAAPEMAPAAAITAPVDERAKSLQRCAILRRARAHWARAPILAR